MFSSSCLGWKSPSLRLLSPESETLPFGNGLLFLLRALAHLVAATILLR